MKLILFFILPALIYGIEEDDSKEEQFAIDDTQKDSDPEFETKAHHTTGSFYYVLNKSQPQTRRNDFVPAAPNTRPVWRPCKSKIEFCLNVILKSHIFQYSSTITNYRPKPSKTGPEESSIPTKTSSPPHPPPLFPPYHPSHPKTSRSNCDF